MQGLRDLVAIRTILREIHSDLLNKMCLIQQELGIPDHFPEMIIKIIKVAAPKCLSCRLDDLRARASSLLHHRVNLFSATDILSDGEFCRAVGSKGKVDVVSNGGSGPESE